MSTTTTTTTTTNTTTTATATATSATKGRWGPYTGAADFGANMGIILAALFAAVALALAANAAIRLLLSRCNRSLSSDRRHDRVPTDPEKQQQPPPPPLPPALTLSSTAGMKSAECAICLAEFAAGDRVRVLLPACGHAFHDGCVERWWLQAGRQSCPTCRATCCQAPSAAAAEPEKL